MPRKYNVYLCIKDFPQQNPTFEMTVERKTFARDCLPIYKKYYPEVLEEIRGLADRGKKANKA